jgi:hypothetical protein
MDLPPPINHIFVDYENVPRVLDHLRKQVRNRLRTRKKLVSHLTSVIGKQSTEAGIDKLIEELLEAGHILIDAKGGVLYALPSTG